MGELKDVIGDKAEELVWKFCVIDRAEMEQEALRTNSIPAEGRTFAHIGTGEPVHCSAAELGIFLVQTVADFQDQSFGWQSALEEGRTQALWPGLFKPTLRMSQVSRYAAIARSYGQLQVVPPVFDHCTKILSVENEREARDLYWKAVIVESPAGMQDELVADLLRASQLNPFVAEPHVVRAQLHMQRQEWDKAADAGKAALQQFYAWATQWDNRMPFAAWVAWTRSMLLQCSYKEWPSTHRGLESLGAVRPAQ